MNLLAVEHCGAVVKHWTRDRGVVSSIPTSTKCCVLEQDTVSTLLSTGFYPWKISPSLLIVLNFTLYK